MNRPGAGDGGVRSSPDGAVADRVRIVPAEHSLHHLGVFSEADLVAEAVAAADGTPLANTRVVGLGSGFFVDVDFHHPDHEFREMTDDGWNGPHAPAGAWYFGADLSVHPDYRGRVGVGVGAARWFADRPSSNVG